jgi:hypothetical protein
LTIEHAPLLLHVRGKGYYEVALHRLRKAHHLALRGSFILALALACNTLTGGPELTFHEDEPGSL